VSRALRRDGQDWLLLERGSTGRDKCLRLHGLDAIPAALQSALDIQM
jgi:hypothetical protein